MEKKKGESIVSISRMELHIVDLVIQDADSRLHVGPKEKLKLTGTMLKVGICEMVIVRE
jgi:hypothetical protein